MTSPILICRRHIDVRSGAGRMIAEQAAYFRFRGHDVTVSCDKLSAGAEAAFPDISLHYTPRILRRLLPAKFRAWLYENRIARFRGASRGIVVDHGQTLADADILYVHNFIGPEMEERHPGYAAETNSHGGPCSDVSAGTTVIANSNMVRNGLIERFSLRPDNVVAVYPGYDPDQFNPAVRSSLRSAAREEMGVSDDQLLIGLLTSGQFEKRGLDVFLDSVELLQRTRPEVRALVVGGRRKPPQLHSHSSGKDAPIYRPTCDDPEKYYAAMDLFLYPARYEEFGIVVLEAMGMGVPIVCSQTVGAAELLASVSEDLVVSVANESVKSYCRIVEEVLAMNREQLDDLGDRMSKVAKLHTSEQHNSSIAEIISMKS